MAENKQSNSRDMLGRMPLISVDKAQQIILSHLQRITASEIVVLEDALDRICADDIQATEDLPNHPRSTMDGFAVIAADTFGASESMPCYLNIQGEVLMGQKPDGTVTRGNCFCIATGGLIPQGADSVVMFEHTVPVDDQLVEIVKGVGQGTNVIGKGDDIKNKALALPAGHLLRPQDLGLLAGLGIHEVNVIQKLKIGILSTGDEIVPYNGPCPPGKIRNINSIALAGQARRLGAEVTDYGIVADNRENFFPAIEKAVAENDLVLFSGGSSVGARDLGEKAIETLGTPGVLVHGVALKPGKPVLIGLHDNTPIFGLPGHPVSAMVCFDLFVKLAIQLLNGTHRIDPVIEPYVDALLARNIASAPGRKDIVRVQLVSEQGHLKAYPVLGKSGSISTLTRSHGYIVIEETLQGVSEESQVKVHLYT